jgi:copper chaperone CopZ
MLTYRIPIEGMTCTSCVSRITRALRGLDGVESVKVDLGSDSAIVGFDAGRTSLEVIGATIGAAGYEASVETAGPFTPATRGSRPSLAHSAAALPARLKLAGGLAVGFAALLVAGVPFTLFVPFAGLAACLGMHLLMGHGHGDHHVGEHSPESTVDR